MKIKKQDRTAVFLALMSVLFWSWAATAFKKSLEFHTPWFVVFFGSLVTVAVLLVTAAATGKRIRSNDILPGALRGFLNPFLYYLVLLHAYNGLPAQVAMVVNYLWPVVLVLLSVPLLGQRVNRMGFAGILVSFSGVAVMAFSGSFDMPVTTMPLILAFFSTIVWSVYWLVNTKNTGDTVGVLLVNFLFGSLWLTLYGIAAGECFLPELRALPWLLYVGVLEMGITYIMWNTALKRAESTASVGSLVFLTPFLALIPIGLVVGEGIAIQTITGLVLVTGGILMERRSRKEQPHGGQA